MFGLSELYNSFSMANFPRGLLTTMPQASPSFIRLEATEMTPFRVDTNLQSVVSATNAAHVSPLHGTSWTASTAGAVASVRSICQHPRAPQGRRRRRRHRRA